MGLRCSLTGHTFGDSEVEREREERGDEVVVTLREYKTCSRCGERKIVTENKEVTSLSEAAGDASLPEEDDDDGHPDGDITEAESETADVGQPSSPTGADDDGPKESDTVEDQSTDVGTEASQDREATQDQDAAEVSEDDDREDDAVLIDADERRGPAAVDDSNGGTTASDDWIDEKKDDARPVDEATTEASPTPAEPDDVDAPTDEEPAVDATSDDVSAVDEVPAEEQSADETDEESDPESSTAEEDGPQDDAVILDDDATDDDRGYGEWPERNGEDRNQGEEGTTAWPGQERDDAGFDATAPDEETAPDVEVEGVTGSGGDAVAEEDELSNEDDAVTDDAEVIDPDPEPPEADSGDGFTSASSAPRPDQRVERSGEADLVCPECGSTARSKASLRVGDICPECKRGYLAEEERNR